MFTSIGSHYSKTNSHFCRSKLTVTSFIHSLSYSILYAIETYKISIIITAKIRHRMIRFILCWHILQFEEWLVEKLNIFVSLNRCVRCTAYRLKKQMACLNVLYFYVHVNLSDI